MQVSAAAAPLWFQISPGQHAPRTSASSALLANVANSVLRCSSVRSSSCQLLRYSGADHFGVALGESFSVSVAAVFGAAPSVLRCSPLRYSSSALRHFVTSALRYNSSALRHYVTLSHTALVSLSAAVRYYGFPPLKHSLLTSLFTTLDFQSVVLGLLSECTHSVVSLLLGDRQYSSAETSGSINTGFVEIQGEWD